MATERKPRLTLSLDETSMEVLTQLEKFTGLSPAQTIQKLFPAHFGELCEYLTWFEQLPPGPSWQRTMGPNLLISYGPDDLISGIKRLDPTYETEGEKLAKSLTDTPTN